MTDNLSNLGFLFFSFWNSHLVISLNLCTEISRGCLLIGSVCEKLKQKKNGQFKYKIMTNKRQEIAERGDGERAEIDNLD